MTAIPAWAAATAGAWCALAGVLMNAVSATPAAMSVATLSNACGMSNRAAIASAFACERLHRATRVQFPAASRPGISTRSARAFKPMSATRRFLAGVLADIPISQPSPSTM